MQSDSPALGQMQPQSSAGGNTWAIASAASFEQNAYQPPVTTEASVPAEVSGPRLVHEIPCFDLQLPDAELKDEEETFFAALFSCNRLLGQPSGDLLLCGGVFE